MGGQGSKGKGRKVRIGLRFLNTLRSEQTSWDAVLMLREEQSIQELFTEAVERSVSLIKQGRKQRLIGRILLLGSIQPIQFYDLGESGHHTNDVLFVHDCRQFLSATPSKVTCFAARGSKFLFVIPEETEAAALQNLGRRRYSNAT